VTANTRGGFVDHFLSFDRPPRHGPQRPLHAPPHGPTLEAS